MVKASVMEIYDLQTQVGKGTVLKVHTPIGNNVKRHLLGHFLQYKQFKYLGARVTLIPASTLPADPLQLSYDVGDANIDPRDMVNPILWKHYHGETMLTDVLNTNVEKSYDQEQNIDYLPGSALDSQIYNQLGEGSNQMDRVYPKTLMDTSFRKAGIQQGFSTFVKPYAYNVVSPVQILPREVTPSAQTTTKFMGYSVPEGVELSGSYPVQTSAGKLTGSEVTRYQSDDKLIYGNSANLTLATNRLTPVGWLDTISRERVAGPSATSGTGAITSNPPNGSPVSGDFALCPNLAAYPMLYVLMPPAYKTEFFFRLIIKHYYAFRGFRSCFSVQSIPSAGIWTNLPAPGNYTPPASSSVSSMVADLEGDDSTNTVEVENGTLLTMADGAEGDA